MKKLFLLSLLVLTVALSCAAFAETADTAPAPITGNIEEGSYVLRIPLAPGEDGQWLAEDVFSGEETVRLAYAQAEDGAFVVRYDPVKDGTVTVHVRHYDAHVCDEVHTFDLLVSGGKIAEVTGGSYTASPDEETMDPYLSGKWLEKDTQFTEMTLTKNPEGGWDAEITSPLTHGAYLLRATLYYDCDLDAFCYRDGVLYNLPADYEEGKDLGEPAASDASGSFLLIPDETGLPVLSWAAEHNPEARDILFQPADLPDGAEGID